jgi:hypothetical protein
MSDTMQPIGVRRRDNRERCIEALRIANAKGPGNLDVAGAAPTRLPQG